MDQLPIFRRPVLVLSALAAAAACSHAIVADWVRAEAVPASSQPEALTGSAVAVYQTASSPGNSNEPVSAALWAGAPLATANARASGAVQAWSFNGPEVEIEWFYAGQIASAAPQSGALFGAAIASTGTKLVVGSPGYRSAFGTSRDLAGRAEVFTITSPLTASASGTSAVLAPPAPGPRAGDLYGSAVAAFVASDGFVALVGAPGTDFATAVDGGAIHAFRQSGTAAGEHFQAVVLADALPGDKLGASIEFDGVTAFAGISRDGGQVVAFPFVGGAFDAPAAVLPPARSEQVLGFGRSLSVQAGLLAVGAPGVAGGPASEGAVYLFDAAPPHALRSIVPSPFPGECSGFGTVLSMRGGMLVVGTAQGTEFLDDGLVAIYSVDAASGMASLQSMVSGPAGSGFGAAVATSGAHVAIGSPSSGNALSGSVATVSRGYGPRSPDINGDGVVNGLDLGELLANYRWNALNVATDLNYDDTVDGADLAILLGAWGPVN